MKDAYDALMVGTGPASWAAAALIARAGFSLLVIDTQAPPPLRPATALLPQAQGLLKRLGLSTAGQQQRWSSQWGFQFVPADGTLATSIPFPEQLSPDDARAWHLHESDLIPLLRQEAVAAGVEVAEGFMSAEPLFEVSRARGLQLRSEAGDERMIAARVLIDGAGPESPLPRDCGGISPVEMPRLTAIWGLYQAVQHAGDLQGSCTALLKTTVPGACCWAIPLAGDLTSVGVVGGDELLAARGAAATVFEDALVKCPALAERLIRASLHGNLQTARELDYQAQRGAGEGWLLIGPALAAVAPLVGMQLHLDLKSAELAATAVIDGLKYGDTSAQQLGCWTGEFLTGVTRARQFTRSLVEALPSLEGFLGQSAGEREALADFLAGGVFSRGAGTFLSRWDSPPLQPPAVRAKRPSLEVSS